MVVLCQRRWEMRRLRSLLYLSRRRIRERGIRSSLAFAFSFFDADVWIAALSTSLRPT